MTVVKVRRKPREHVERALARLVKDGSFVSLSRVMTNLRHYGVSSSFAEKVIREHRDYDLVKRGRGWVVIRTVSSRARAAAAERVDNRPVSRRPPVDPPSPPGTAIVDEFPEIIRQRLETKMIRSQDIPDHLFPNYVTAWALLDIAKTIRRARG